MDKSPKLVIMNVRFIMEINIIININDNNSYNDYNGNDIDNSNNKGNYIMPYNSNNIPLMKIMVTMIRRRDVTRKPNQYCLAHIILKLLYS